jgi:hypothetical protein
MEGSGMKFILEVDMGDTAFDGKAAAELGRILRYWAGSCTITSWRVTSTVTVWALAGP